MVKCFLFMLGLGLALGGFFHLSIGVFNSWYYGELRLGLFLAIGALLLSILFFHLSYKLERDEKYSYKESAIKMEIQKLQKEKESHFREKQGEKELTEKELEVKHCPECGTKLKPEKGYCVSCGTPIY